jgi:hypothetical protein
MQFPGPVRAVVGLLANAADEAKHLPDRAIELPMLAVSTALQMSLRAQQRYARLAARGDEILNRRPPSEDPPPWATFDDPVSTADLPTSSLSAEHAQAASDLLDELLGVTEGPTVPDDGSKPADHAAPALADSSRAQKTPATKASATKASATKPAAKKTASAAKKAAPATKKATPAQKTEDARAKAVSKPRHTAPSRFDAVDDE